MPVYAVGAGVRVVACNAGVFKRTGEDGWRVYRLIVQPKLPPLHTIPCSIGMESNNGYRAKGRMGAITRPC